MKITINGIAKELKAPLHIAKLLEIEGYKDMLLAVAHNGTFVAREYYNTTKLEDGDEIEIVAPMQGG